MATRMGIRELRDSLTAALRRVERGERIEVTRDGHPVAVLAPYARREIDRLIGDGRATPGGPFEARLPSLEWPLDRSTTAVISEGREDRF